MAGRFNSQRDVDFFTTVTQELVGNQQGGKDGIINQLVTIFQIDVRETPTNMYGEASQGKFYKPGVDLNCLIEAEDFEEMTKEQYEGSLNSLRMAFGKFDAICQAMNPPPSEEASEEADTQA